MANTKRTGKAMLFSEQGSAAVGAVNYNIGERGCDLHVSTHLNAQPQQAVLQAGPERGYACDRPLALDGPLHSPQGDPAALWVLCEGRPAAFARLSATAFDKAKARAALDAALHPPAAKSESRPPTTVQKAPPEAPVLSVAALSAPAAPAAKPGIGFDMQMAGGGAGASSFRGRMSPYGLQGQPDAAAFEIIQPLRADEPASAPPSPVLEPGPSPESGVEMLSEPLEVRPEVQPTVFVPEPEPEHDPVIIQAASAQPMAARARPRPMGITVKRAAPLAMPRDTPLWADIAPHVEAMLDALPQVQPFAASVDSARFAALPLDGTVQCYIGSVIVGGIKVLLQAVPVRPLHRPAGFDHTLVSRDGESFWVRYEIES